MPKYDKPNSFTFFSSAAHWSRESGSEMNVSTEVKFAREMVLMHGYQSWVPLSMTMRTECYDPPSPKCSLSYELDVLRYD